MVSLDRVSAALALTRQITVVCVPSEIPGIFVCQSKEIDQASQGKTPEEARLLFGLCLLAALLMMMRPNVAWHDPCPDDVWSDLVARDGAIVSVYEIGLVSR